MASTNESQDIFGAREHIRHNFHCRVGNPPQKSVPVHRIPISGGYDRAEPEPQPEQPVSKNGFPVPGEQSPKAAMVMNNDFFVS
jgi:hypothetical protein